MLVGHHHSRVADLDLGMPNAAVRTGHAHDLGRAKGLFIELDRFRRAVDDQVGGYAVISLGDGLYFTRHVYSP